MPMATYPAIRNSKPHAKGFRLSPLKSMNFLLAVVHFAGFFTPLSRKSPLSMVKIGRPNNLTVLEVSSRGVFLDGEEQGELELVSPPPPHCRTGQVINAFLYYDAREQLVATTERPYVMVDEFAWLEVLGVTAAGAFLDWGLERDLFVPARELTHRVEVGQGLIARVFLDGRGRIIASADEDRFLNLSPAAFEAGQKVNLLVSRQTDLGFHAIINHTHGGVLYANEVFQPLEVGDRGVGYIKKIREDGKIDLTLNPSGYKAAGPIAEQILSLLTRVGGYLEINDNSSPEEIYDLLGVSKKKFKMAVGGLLKQGRIQFEKNGIRLNH